MLDKAIEDSATRASLLLFAFQKEMWSYFAAHVARPILQGTASPSPEDSVSCNDNVLIASPGLMNNLAVGGRAPDRRTCWTHGAMKLGVERVVSQSAGRDAQEDPVSAHMGMSLARAAANNGSDQTFQ